MPSKLSLCCAEVAKESKVVGEICSEIERRFTHSCRKMDIGAEYTDYSTYPYQNRKESPDGKTSIAEVIATADRYVEDEYVQTVKKQDEVGKKGSFIDFLAQKNQLPAWVIRSKEVWSSVHKSSLEKKMSPKDLVLGLLSFYISRVTYLGKPDRITVGADGVFEMGFANCLEWILGFKGLVIPFDIKSMIVEVPTNNKNDFHIGIRLKVGAEFYCIDLDDSNKHAEDYLSTCALLNPVTDLAARAFFISEEVVVGKGGEQDLLFAHKMVPNNFYITYVLGRYLQKLKRNDDARKWLSLTRTLNPSFSFEE